MKSGDLMKIILKLIFLPSAVIGGGFCLSSEMNLAFRSALTYEECDGNDGGMTCMCWGSAL